MKPAPLGIGQQQVMYDTTDCENAQAADARLNKLDNKVCQARRFVFVSPIVFGQGLLNLFVLRQSCI